MRTWNDSNIDRLLKTFNREVADRPPNFEILIDARSCSHILGRETTDTLWSMPPEDAVRIALAVGQDAIPCSLTWCAEEGSVHGPADLAEVQPPDPKEAREKLQRYVDAVEGTKVGLCARLSGPLTLAYMSTGPTPIESFMYLLYDEPQMIEDLMDLYMDYHIAMMETIKDLPFHMYYIGDDLSSSTGPLISPADLDRLWAPRAERLVKAALATERPVLFHCCGDETPILPYLVDWGVQGVHPLQPVANDIDAIHAEFGDRITLVGNIDVSELLSFGTPEQAREDTFEHLDKFYGDNAGYIVCSSHSIIDSVVPENYLAMVAAAHEWKRSTGSD